MDMQQAPIPQRMKKGSAFQFTIIRDANNVALLAGGTGITAFIAFIDRLTNEFQNNIFLAYGARKSELLLYRDLIDAKAVTNNGFHAFYFVETDNKNKSGSTKEQSTEFFTGCLSLEAIWNQLKNPQETTYYIAGPPAMIQALTGNLLKKDISPEMIKVDAWD